jgi:hypothetical protein
MEKTTSLTYASGTVGYAGSNYTIWACDPVGTDGLHIFLQDSDNLMAVFLKVGYTTINGSQLGSVTSMITTLGNPPDISTFGATLTS